MATLIAPGAIATPAYGFSGDEPHEMQLLQDMMQLLQEFTEEAEGNPQFATARFAA